MNLLGYLDERPKFFWITLSFLAIFALGILDYLTGYELAFSLFYVLPISLVTWVGRRRWGFLAAFLSALAWLAADILAGSIYSHPFIYIWNTLIRLGFFTITVFLLASLEKAMQKERDLARNDFLTGALNSRFFYDLVQAAIDRFQRYHHPFSLAYIDLDNFKEVNDEFGHQVGDDVLRIIASSARQALRRTDVLARVGGDEFVLLLPETGPEAVRVAISKYLQSVMQEMQRRQWPVTLSIGVLTCSEHSPTGTDELIRLVDDLMYSVKHTGKNAVRFLNYAG